MTWSDPVDISGNTLPGYRNAFATGPGHGICLRDGTLMIPVWMVPKEYGQEEKSHHPSVVSTLYSKDYGETWEVGEILGGNERVISPSESVLLELSDGCIMINARNESGEKCRAVAVSSDGISGWTDLELDRQLQDPGCFGSLARYDNATILFTNADSSVGRENISVKASYDDGKTWKKKKVISWEGGYSDIAVGKNKEIYLLAERENEQGKYMLSYSLFNMKWFIK